MEEPKKLIIIEDFKSSTIRVKIGKETVPNRVDENDRVIPNPRIIGDYSEYVRPYDDGDAIYGNHPFDSKYAKLEVKDSLYIDRPRIYDYTDLIESKLLRLPYPAKDAVPFLRDQCFAVDQELDECKFADEVLNYADDGLAEYIVKQFYDMAAITGDSLEWGNFLAYIESPVEEYNKAAELWAKIRFLQSKIAQHERLAAPSTVDNAARKEDKPVCHYATLTDLFTDRKPENIESCIQALRDYRPEKPILNKGLTWNGSTKDKGLIVAWIERMEDMSPPKIHKLSNRKDLIILLNSYFTKLNMGKDARVFSNTVDKNIKDRFTALLPK